MQWRERYPEYRKMIEEELPQYLPVAEGEHHIIAEAMEYSLLGGGKRIRASLLLAMCELCGGQLSDALPFAAAIEMVHAYSLIHDDLPCMDDDVLRRGKPTCHVQYGEANALLAGDALLTHAFEVMSGSYFAGMLPGETVLRCIHTLSKAIGAEGMIGGQAIDIIYEEMPTPAKLLEQLHLMKTAALLKASAVIGCMVAGAAEEVILQAGIYADKIGLAFQIVDDILDATQTSEILGKSASDAENGKTTYITLYGEDVARERVRRLVLEADLAIKGTVLDDPILYQLADALAEREK